MQQQLFLLVNIKQMSERVTTGRGASKRKAATGIYVTESAKE